MIKGGGEDKEFHEWGQDVQGMVELIEQVTEPGQVVLDPFLGAGTTAIASLMTSRRLIGADVEESCINTTLNRIEKLGASSATLKVE